MADSVGTNKTGHYDSAAQICLELPVAADEQEMDNTASASSDLPTPDYKTDAVKLRGLEKPHEQIGAMRHQKISSEMTDAETYVSDSAEQLPKFHQVLTDRLSWMDNQAQDFDADTNVVVRESSDWISGAGKDRKKFQENL